MKCAIILCLVMITAAAVVINADHTLSISGSDIQRHHNIHPSYITKQNSVVRKRRRLEEHDGLRLKFAKWLFKIGTLPFSLFIPGVWRKDGRPVLDWRNPTLRRRRHHTN